MHIHQPSQIEARDEGLNVRAPVKVCSGLNSVYVLCVCAGQATGADFIKGYMIKAPALFQCGKIGFDEEKDMFWCKYHGRAYLFKVDKTVALSEKGLTAKLTEALCRMASCRCNVCRKNISSLMAWKLKREIVNVEELMESVEKAIRAAVYLCLKISNFFSHT